MEDNEEWSVKLSQLRASLHNTQDKVISGRTNSEEGFIADYGNLYLTPISQM